MRRSVPEGVSALVAALAVAGFVALAAFDVRVPGLYYDELFQLTPALAFVKGGLGSAVAWVPGTEISLAGHPLPLMAHSYIGAVKTIAFVPVAAAFGISPESVRLFTIAVAALALVAMYLFARRLFRDPAVAALGTLLVAADPSYVFYSRIDFGPSVFMFLLKAVGLWQLTDWWRSRRLRSLVLGALAFGLGVYDKANFAWIVAAVPLAALALDYRGVRERLDRRSLVWAGGAFVAGCLPFLAYNASWPPRTIQPALKGTLHVAGGNASGNVFSQLYQRLEQLLRLLDGRTIAELLTGRGAVPPLVPALVLMAALAIAALYALPRTRAQFRPAAFVVLSGALVLAASAVTPGGSYPHHVLLAYPAPHLAAAALFVQGARLLRGAGRPLAIAAAAATAAAALAVDVTADVHVISRLRTSGGSGNFSDRIYALDDYLLRHDRERRLVVLDWGIYQNVIALSEGRLRGVELYQQLEKDRPRGSVLDQLDDASSRYLLHAPGATNFPAARRRFFAYLRARGARAHLEKAISDRRGDPLFEVYRVAA